MREGSYVSIWSVKKGTRGSGNYYDVQMSCSTKRKDTGEYVNDFSGYVRFIAGAAETISKYDGFDAKQHGNQPLRMKLGVMDIKYTYDKKNDKNYLNVAVIGVEEPDNNIHQAATHTEKEEDDFMKIPENDTEELPFK